MLIERLQLSHFRNIDALDYHPDPHINLILGLNGQGKTSILEAIDYLSSLKSFRGSKTQELIQQGQETSAIKMTVTSRQSVEQGSDFKMEFSAELQGSHKKLFLNRKPVRSALEYMKQAFGSIETHFHAVVFNPGDHELIRGGPTLRREYLNRVLSAEDSAYLEALYRYKRSLDQKNAILKSQEGGASTSIRALLESFNQQLAAHGSVIAHARIKWLIDNREKQSDKLRKIAPDQAPLSSIYLSDWVPELKGITHKNKELNKIHFAGQAPRPSINILEQAFLNQLSILEEVERRQQTALVGVHRDDWCPLLGERPLKGTASQGEVRSALLAIKLCEIDSFEKASGCRPVFLLDDFSSELDRKRREFLLEFILESRLQVFVTSTEQDFKLGKKTIIVNGKQQEINE